MLSDYTAPPQGVGGLYLIRLSPKHYYGGRTVCFETRWRDHLRSLKEGTHSNTRMQRVFNKYGEFTPEVLFTLDREAQPDAEQAWLDEHHGQPGCVNLSPHATGGNVVVWTSDMRKKLSEAHMGSTRSAASIEKQQQTIKSRPDLVEKARESLERNRPSPGTPLSEKHKASLSSSLRGRKQDPEAVARRAESNRGRKNSPETLKQMSDSARRRAFEKPTRHGDETRSLISSQQRGRVWVNNGSRNQRLFPERAALLVQEGWVYGRY